MNQWIEQMAQERTDRLNKLKTVESGMTSIWRELRDSVFRAAKEYGERYPTGAEQYDHVETSQQKHPADDCSVWIVDSRELHFPMPPVKRGISVKLNRETLKIAIDSKDSIDIDVNQDNQVCLRLDGKEMTVDDATKAILAPILFPDVVRS